jgi:hypothetical protein
MHKKLVVEVPDDVDEVELHHPSGEVEDVDVDQIDDDDDPEDEEVE